MPGKTASARTDKKKDGSSVTVISGTDMSGEDWTSVTSDISQFAETDGERELADWIA